MLSLGTEKYPEESSYQRFIQKHGGRKNASTSADHTNYHFNISHSYLNEALDRLLKRRGGRGREKRERKWKREKREKRERIFNCTTSDLLNFLWLPYSLNQLLIEREMLSIRNILKIFKFNPHLFLCLFDSISHLSHENKHSLPFLD